MKFTAEQITKMKAATSAEELIALAKAEGIEATEEEIKAKFDAMHKEGEIADEELNNVAGGFFCDYERPSTVNVEVVREGVYRCPKCGNNLICLPYRDDPNGESYYLYYCDSGFTSRHYFRRYYNENVWTEHDD